MKLCINGVTEVYVKRLRFQEGNDIDHILQVQLLNPCDVPGLHQRLVEALKQRRENGGEVMDVEKFKPHENRTHESEIRILGGKELEIIDLARLLGYGVEQMHENLEDTASSI